MYQYIARLVAPGVVEFYTPTPQGHRIVRIHLDSIDPRITAYNESSRSTTYATLYLQEVMNLIDRSKRIVEANDPSVP